MSQKQYTASFLTDIFDEWEYNQTHAQCPMSMRQFCEDWNVPRSTFQGWLEKRNLDTLPVDRFYAKPADTPETKKAPINAEAVEVLRMLASELSAISTDLDELLDKL